MPVNSKDKGKRGELEVVNLLKAAGYQVNRSAQFKGNTGQAADVEGLPYIHIEVKRVEKLNVSEAMQQAAHDATKDMPAVFHRKNDEKWMVTMRIDDWLKLYGEYHNSRRIEELEETT